MRDNAILARLDRLHVDRDIAADTDAVIGGAPCDMCRAGTRDQCFGRDAAGVDAGAAEVFAFDERNRAAGFCEPHRERRAGLTAADEDSAASGPIEVRVPKRENLFGERFHDAN